MLHCRAEGDMKEKRTIITSFLGIARRLPKGLDDHGLNLGRFQSAGGGDGLITVGCGRPNVFGGNGAGRDRELAVGLEGGMGDAPDVPELEEEEAALVVDGLRQELMSFHLLVGHNAGTVAVPVAFGGDVRGLSNDQGGRRSLAIVKGIERRGHLARAGSQASQRGHDNSMRELKRSHGVGRK